MNLKRIKYFEYNIIKMLPNLIKYLKKTLLMTLMLKIWIRYPFPLENSWIHPCYLLSLIITKAYGF